ncbi:hypothetical protein BDY19DRAFT_948413 [Irpex rosettiformis]|uniref:Uncharacterized protein n=1 Tax=Irpex rosettiformis TaxID=378272 RepID=A0ACB8U2H2_9APHY|nr:hypothetical protein BDY19DRAFT_948413 [Irpex rosettiformis]
MFLSLTTFRGFLSERFPILVSTMTSNGGTCIPVLWCRNRSNLVRSILCALPICSL